MTTMKTVNHLAFMFTPSSRARLLTSKGMGGTVRVLEAPFAIV
jgi:hypothetical protein